MPLNNDSPQNRVLDKIWSKCNRELINRYGNVRLDDVNRAIEEVRREEAGNVAE